MSLISFVVLGIGVHGSGNECSKVLVCWIVAWTHDACGVDRDMKVLCVALARRVLENWRESVSNVTFRSLFSASIYSSFNCGRWGCWLSR